MICGMCPRDCKAERSETEANGVCGMPLSLVIARAALHFGEEPPICGKRGAGTVFFSGCSLHCIFCQNEKISRGNFGVTVSEDRFFDILNSLAEQGAQCIDLVTPTHYAPILLPVLRRWKPMHPNLPIVWNSSGYEKTETLEMLRDTVDIFLPDFKFFETETAQRYAFAPDYSHIAENAVREMYRLAGPVCFLKDGRMKSGVMVRHLLLPGHLPEAKAIMDFISEEFPKGSVYLSLMSQYVPCGDAKKLPPLNRRVRAGEYRAACEYMRNLGLPGFIQETSSAVSDFIPSFDLTGVQ